MTRRDFLRLGGGLALSGVTLTAFGRMLVHGEPVAGADVLERILAKASREAWRRLPIGEVVGRVGREFVDTPYLGFTLEIDDHVESCVVTLLGLDCVTFFESSLAIARMIRRGERTPADLLRHVTHTRYRGGRIDGYLSRLHYTTDWIHDNVRKGVVRDVTRDLPGAAPFEARVGFMSANPDKYRQLAANPRLLPEKRRLETAINARRMWYVPKEHVAKAEARLGTGDIIGLTTSVAGLDISHTGLCYRDEAGVLRFMHASSTQKKVVLDARLSECIGRNTGIMAARPLG
jgi:hypothetical protein